MFDGTNYAPRRDTPASLLIGRAMALIPTPRQWSKSGSANDGRRCILQALSWSDSHHTWSEVGIAAVDATHAAAQRRGFDRVQYFNDHPNTTHAAVLACMEEARLAAMESVPAEAVSALRWP